MFRRENPILQQNNKRLIYMYGVILGEESTQFLYLKKSGQNGYDIIRIYLAIGQGPFLIPK